MPDVVALSAFAEQGEQLGAKLRRLAELAGWGYRVPDGFALTRAAVDAILEGRASPVLAGVAREHRALCQRLGRARPPLAVRSATTAEDSAERSFAGMFDSVLGVCGPEQLAAAIETCIASRRNARAELYGSSGAMTVGVQQLIEARAAGVAFSRHPVTHRSDRLVIEAVLGLGSTMIAGVSQPDHIEVGRADQRVLRYDIGAKQRRALPAPGGGLTAEDTPPEERRARSLSADEIEQLCAALVEIEGRLDWPVDIEWVFAADGSLVIVQARPITGAPPKVQELRWDPLRYAGKLGAPRGE